jgi:hypothetical protein
MGFVDNQISRGDLQRVVTLPVKIIEGDPGTIVIGLCLPVWLLPPHIPPRNQAGIGIHENSLAIEAVTTHGIKGSVNAEAILKILVVEAKHNHRVNIPDSVLLWKVELHERLEFAPPEQNECAACSSRSVKREVQSVWDVGDTEREWLPRPNLVAADLRRW